MSSELSFVAANPYRMSIYNSRQLSTSTDRLFESLREEQFSNNQKAAREFLEQTLELELPSNDLHEALKDGVLLCSLMNKLQPDVIPQISRKDLAFVKMENINNFLNAARQLGLHASDLFETVDLYEAKRMEKVVATILAIARITTGRFMRRNSDFSIEQPMLDKFRELNIKDSNSLKLYRSEKKSEKLSRNAKLDTFNNHHNISSSSSSSSNNSNSNSNNHNNHNRRKSILKNERKQKTINESENIDLKSIIHHSTDQNFNISDTKKSADNSASDIQNSDDTDNSNSDTTLQRKRPSLRKSVTTSQLFTKTLEQKEEEIAESEFAEELAPLPVPPAPTKSEKPVSRNSSTRSHRKTHVRYKSDRTSEISLNKNDRISGFGGGGGGGGDFKRRESISGTNSLGDSPKEKLVLEVDDEIAAQYQLGNCIGKGQFGAVYRALNLGTGQMTAVKRIKLEGKSPDEVEQLMQEVELLKSLSHPSVVKYEAYIKTKDHINIILEYVENGSLLHTLKSFGNFPERLVVSYVVKILEGLVYLHFKQVVHCDLKAANILTTKNGNVKLSDFGVSLNLKMMEQVCTNIAGTPNWMAPEVIELKGASTASDIWSLGCTVVELLTGKPPYSDLLAMTALFRIVEDDCPPLPENISDDLTDFLKQCFHKNPSMRPTARDLFKHNWIKKNWVAKELRTQESLPFLRRITSDTDLSELRTSSLAKVSNVDDPIVENSNNESHMEQESTENPSPYGFPINSSSPQKSPLSSQTNVAITAQLNQTPTKLFAATPMVPHRFVKNSFSKPVECRICHSTVKKHVVMCEGCNMVCHSKCSIDAPWPCTLQNRTIRYVPLEVIDNSVPRFNNKSPSESDVPTITSPISSLPTTPQTPKRNRFSKKIKKDDSVNSQTSIADSVDSSSSAAAASSSIPGTPNMADSSWYGNNSRPLSIIVVEDHNNFNFNNFNNYNNHNNHTNHNNGGGENGKGSGKGSGKGKTSKLKRKGDEDCVIM